MTPAFPSKSDKLPWIWIGIFGGLACAIIGFEAASFKSAKQPPAPSTSEVAVNPGPAQSVSPVDTSSLTPSKPATTITPPAVVAHVQTAPVISPATSTPVAAEAPPDLPEAKPLPASNGIAALLGASGTTDALSQPAAFPKGMLAFLKGVDLLGAFHPAEAIPLFTQAIAADGENPDFYTARGAAYVVAERMQEALPDLQRATKLNPRKTLASRLTRLAYLMLGDQVKASKYYGHGSSQSVDFLITEVGVGYGSRATAQKYHYNQDIRDQQKTTAAIEKLPTIAGMVASAYRNGDQTSAATLFALGVEQFNSADFASARRSLRDVVSQNPNDLTARYYNARCMLETGDPDLARRELTYILCWKRFLPEAFAARAICAARQSDVARAEADLKIAEKLDASKAAEARTAVAQAPAPTPTAAGNDATQSDKLDAKAKSGATFDELAGLAVSLRKAVDARRLRYDEQYQDKLYELCSIAREQPSGDRVADLAAFLRDNNEVRGLQVEPNGAPRFFRQQTGETRQAEIDLAYNLVNEALRVDSGHARCLAIKATLLFAHYNRCEEAEAAAQAALRSDAKLIEAHMALSDCYKEYAARWRAKAVELRTPKTYSTVTHVVDQNGSFIRDDTVLHSIPPSAEDLARAAECDRQADLNEKREWASLNEALACAKGTPQEPYYRALLHVLRRDFQSARPWLEKAVQANPSDPRMHYALANCLKSLGLDTEYLEEFSKAIDLQETTAEVWLQVAWQSIEKTAWDTARTQLRRASEHDPSDARIYAFQGVLEEFGSHDSSAAAAAYRCALAQEEARARLNGTSYANLKETSPLSPESLGLSMMLRLKLACMAFKSQPDAAIAYYSATAANEKRLSDWNLAGGVHSALLPKPQRDEKSTGGAPPLVSLLKNSRIFLGQALLNRARSAEAAIQFAEAERFANRLPAGGTAYLEFELEPQYVPFRVSSMPIYVKAVHAQSLIQQGKRDEARLELQQVRFYLANRSLDQREMTDDPIPGIYERLAGAVGLR